MLEIALESVFEIIDSLLSFFEVEGIGSSSSGRIKKNSEAIKF
jgi:hypothetical protein